MPMSSAPPASLIQSILFRSSTCPNIIAKPSSTACKHSALRPFTQHTLQQHGGVEEAQLQGRTIVSTASVA